MRLAIAKILLSTPDLLVLDEPTNGLDLLSRERIEEALDAYPGTLLLVSHDRYLLRRIAGKIIALRDGRLDVFPDGYEEFQRRKTKAGQADKAARRLLLEVRLAQLSAALADPKAREVEKLTSEFMQVSQEPLHR